MKKLYRIKRLFSSRRRYLLPAALLAILLFSSAALLLRRPAGASSPPPAEPLPESEPASAPALPSGDESGGWLLAERAGQVAVYSGGRMLFVTDIEPAILRASDRELLRRGIEAESMEAVLMLIEDLSS